MRFLLPCYFLLWTIPWLTYLSKPKDTLFFFYYKPRRYVIRYINVFIVFRLGSIIIPAKEDSCEQIKNKNEEVWFWRFGTNIYSNTSIFACSVYCLGSWFLRIANMDSKTTTLVPFLLVLPLAQILNLVEAIWLILVKLVGLRRRETLSLRWKKMSKILQISFLLGVATTATVASGSV